MEWIRELAKYEKKHTKLRKVAEHTEQGELEQKTRLDRELREGDVEVEKQASDEDFRAIPGAGAGLKDALRGFQLSVEESLDDDMKLDRMSDAKLKKLRKSIETATKAVRKLESDVRKAAK